jgi:acetyl esterase/lipase
MKTRTSLAIFAVGFFLLAAFLLGAFWFAIFPNASAVAESSITGPLASKLSGIPPALPVGGTSVREINLKIKSGEIELAKQETDLPAGVEASYDVEYGKGGTKPLVLDLFKPREIKKPVPGLIFVHGGAWSSGSRKNYGTYCRHFAATGYVAATIEYRLSGEAPFPAAIQDVNCAIRWMRANATKLGVDPDKIGLVGGSAGGHLVMLAAYAPNDQELEGNGGHNGVRSRVQAVVDFYGLTYLGGDIPSRSPFKQFRSKDPLLQFMGGKTPDDDPELYVKASPIKHLTKDAPPTLILHGTIDELVPVKHSDNLAAKLAELGVPYLYDRIEGWNHGMDDMKEVNAHCVWMMDQFFALVVPLPAQ